MYICASISCRFRAKTRAKTRDQRDTFNLHFISNANFEYKRFCRVESHRRRREERASRLRIRQRRRPGRVTGDTTTPSFHLLPPVVPLLQTRCVFLFFWILKRDQFINISMHFNFQRLSFHLCSSSFDECRRSKSRGTCALWTRRKQRCSVREQPTATSTSSRAKFGGGTGFKY